MLFSSRITVRQVYVSLDAKQLKQAIGATQLFELSKEMLHLSCCSRGDTVDEMGRTCRRVESHNICLKSQRNQRTNDLEAPRVLETRLNKQVLQRR